MVNELSALFVNWPRNRDFWPRESSEWHEIEKNGEKRERRTQPYCFILTTFSLSNKHDLNVPIVRATLKYAFLNMRPKIKFAISVVQVIFIRAFKVVFFCRAYHRFERQNFRPPWVSLITQHATISPSLPEISPLNILKEYKHKENVWNLTAGYYQNNA